MEVAAKLRAIAMEIEQYPERWTQWHHATDSDGRMVSVNSPDAACWCSEGFVLRDTGTSERGILEEVLALKALCEAVGEDVPCYNDRKGRTPSEIVSMFRKAAEILEAGGQP